MDLLREYRGLVDTLTTNLQTGDDEAVPAVLERIVAVDTSLQQKAGVLLAERAQRERTAVLSKRAAKRRAELLQLASKLQRTETGLGVVAARAREALSSADERHDGRAVSAEALMQYAERVSYSNAAPFGQLAMASAAKDGFRGGWGTPAPQQHMLAVSRFAEISRRVAAPDDEAPRVSSAAAEALGPSTGGAPPGWKLGDPIPAPPAVWKPGDPIPAPPTGWKPGDPIPAPPAGWKPGDPIPAPPAGWKPGDPIPSVGAGQIKPEASAPTKPKLTLGLAESDDEDDF